MLCQRKSNTQVDAAENIHLASLCYASGEQRNKQPIPQLVDATENIHLTLLCYAGGKKMILYNS